MKKTNKILAGILSAVVLMSPATTWAGPSITDKVVVVEDLISTGGSSIEVVEALREAGAEVLAVISIFTYETAKADNNFQDANIEKLSLCTISELIDTAVEENYVTSEEGKGIIEWLREI